MAEIVIKLVNGELAGKTIQDINKNVRDANKELTKAAVGTEDWVKAHAKLESAKKLQGDLKSQIESTGKASAVLKGQFGGILSQIPGFGALTGHLNAAKGGVGGLTSSMGLLKGAIAATGIGALVLLVTTLVSWFTKTEKGANMVSGAFKALGATVDTLLGKLFNIKETLQELFSNPVKFFQNLGNDIKKAAEEGYELVQVFDDIEDRQRDLEVRSKEQEIRADQLLLQARNVAKTYEQKIALLDEADAITRASYKEQFALSQEYLNAVNREVAAAEKTGMLGDELLDKQKDARLAYLNLVQEEVNVEEKIANRRAQIIDKQDKANEKASDKREKNLEKEAKDLEESLKKLEELRIKSMDELEAREIAEVNLKYQRELESLTLQGEQKIEAEKLIEEVKGQEIQVIRDKYAGIQAAKDKKAMGEKIAAIDLELAIEQNALNERILARQITEQQYVDQSAQNVIGAEEKKLGIIEAAHGKQSAEYQRAYANFLILQKAAGDNAVKQQEQTSEDMQRAVLATASTFGSVFSLLSDQYEKGTAQWKSFAVAAATMSAIQGAINAYTSAQAIPYVGTILAPIAAATALAAGFINVRKIQNTKATPPVKRALGGPLYGPSHSEGGIPIEAEGGEFIFSRKAVSAIGMNNLIRTNDYFTRKFAPGGPVSPFTDRQAVSRSSSPTTTIANQASANNNMLLQKLTDIEMRIAEWPKTLRVINDVTKTAEGIQTINSIKDEADV